MKGVMYIVYRQPGELLKLDSLSSPRFVSARSQRGVDRSVASDYVVTEDVGAVDSHHQLGPPVGARRFQGDVQGEIPHQSAWGIQTLPELLILVMVEVEVDIK